MASKDDIRTWLIEAKALGATHMLVCVDTYSFEDYPVSVMPGTDAAKVVEHYKCQVLQDVVEVYKLDLDIEAQLLERCAYHI